MLRDTNRYEENRQPWTTQGNPGILPDLPERGYRSLLPAALLLLTFPDCRVLACRPGCAIFLMPGETEAGSAGEQPTEG
jgi:hypothetical protein